MQFTVDQHFWNLSINIVWDPWGKLAANLSFPLPTDMIKWAFLYALICMLLALLPDPWIIMNSKKRKKIIEEKNTLIYLISLAQLGKDRRWGLQR